MTDGVSAPKLSRPTATVPPFQTAGFRTAAFPLLQELVGDDDSAALLALILEELNWYRLLIDDVAELGFPVFTLNWVDYRDRIVKSGDSLQSVVERLKDPFLQLPIAATSIGAGR